MTAIDKDEEEIEWKCRVENGVLILDHVDVSVTSAAFAPDGLTIATAPWDDTIWVWKKNADSSWAPAFFGALEDPVNSVIFSPDGKSLLTAGDDCTARIWQQTADGAWHTVSVLKGHDDTVIMAVFSPDGTDVATASEDGTARVWRSGGNGYESISLKGDDDLSVDTVAFSPTGNRLVMVSGWFLKIWQREGDGTWSLASEVEKSGGFDCAVFSPDGEQILAAGNYGELGIWHQRKSGQWVCISTLEGHEDTILSVAYSSDGRLIVTTSADNTTRLWRLESTGKKDRWNSSILSQHKGDASSSAFSLDARRVVTACTNGVVEIHETGTFFNSPVRMLEAATHHRKPTKARSRNQSVQLVEKPKRWWESLVFWQNR